jgi:hypothetical protein
MMTPPQLLFLLLTGVAASAGRPTLDNTDNPADGHGDAHGHGHNHGEAEGEWMHMESPDGESYWVHEDTGEAVWDDPTVSC